MRKKDFILNTTQFFAKKFDELKTDVTTLMASVV